MKAIVPGIMPIKVKYLCQLLGVKLYIFLPKCFTLISLIVILIS